MAEGSQIVRILRSCESGNIEVIRELIDKGADLDETDESGTTGLQVAAANDQVKPVIKISASIHFGLVSGQHCQIASGPRSGCQLEQLLGMVADASCLHSWTQRGRPSSFKSKSQYDDSE